MNIDFGVYKDGLFLVKTFTRTFYDIFRNYCDNNAFTILALFCLVPVAARAA